MLERDIEKRVKDYARSKGWLAYKFTSPGHAFVPDGLFISPDGKVLFIEFKQFGKKATAGQLREHFRMIQQGVEVYVVDNVEYGKEIIDAKR